MQWVYCSVFADRSQACSLSKVLPPGCLHRRPAEQAASTVSGALQALATKAKYFLSLLVLQCQSTGGQMMSEPFSELFVDVKSRFKLPYLPFDGWNQQ